MQSEIMLKNLISLGSLVLMKAGELTAQGAEIFRPLQETSMHDDIATILHLACCMEHI